MNWQKKYHDMRMSWEKFKPGDMVFVYFPQKKIGCSPKLTSFWRGPFEVLEQWSDVLYAVSCGRKSEKQRKDQILNFESLELDNDETVNDEVLEKVEVDCLSSIDSVEELVNHDEYKRARRKPKWLDDYET